MRKSQKLAHRLFVGVKHGVDGITGENIDQERPLQTIYLLVAEVPQGFRSCHLIQYLIY